MYRELIKFVEQNLDMSNKFITFAPTNNNIYGKEKQYPPDQRGALR
jgi:hypothetical protein